MFYSFPFFRHFKRIIRLEQLRKDRWGTKEAMFMQNSLFQKFAVQSGSLSLRFPSPPDYSSLLLCALSPPSFMDLSFIFFSIKWQKVCWKLESTSGHKQLLFFFCLPKVTGGKKTIIVEMVETVMKLFKRLNSSEHCRSEIKDDTFVHAELF